MVSSAARIFAFDAFISNDDRRYNNPNVLVRDRRSLTDHVFYLQLRKHPIELRAFTARLAELGSAKLEEIINQLPEEWRHDRLGQISAHLQGVRDHAFEFERQLLERLA